MTVRRSWLFFIFEGLILAFLLLGKFLNPSAGSDIAGRVALGTFELGATAVSLLLLSRGRSGNASFFDWAVGALAVLSAAIGLAAYSSTSLPDCPRS